MPKCNNCGWEVSKTYERVVSPDDVDGVRCCPMCPDKMRVNGEIREAKQPRTRANRRNIS